MKRIYLLSFVLLLAFSSGAIAGSGDLFNYDKEAVAAEMADLTELESYVENNPTTTMSVLVQNDNQLLNGLNLTSPNAMGMSFDDAPLGIPSFLWGCVFGVVGVVVVYIVTDEDKDETKKSFYGCIASTLVYVILYAAVWSTAGFWYF